MLHSPQPLNYFGHEELPWQRDHLALLLFKKAKPRFHRDTFRRMISLKLRDSFRVVLIAPSA